MKKSLLVLALAVLLVPSASARVRAVRHPAVRCSFSLVPAWGTSAVPASGLTRGMVFVYAQTAECTEWNGYSTADWIVVEAAPLDAQPAAYVTVAPNPTTEPRTAKVLIAGLWLEITQDGAPAITDPNLVRNGSFHSGIDEWTWDDRFENGRGEASWSVLDANGSPASGSILLRDDGISYSFQRLQCIAATKSTPYRFGAKVRTGAGKERGDVSLALFTYKSPDCSGDFSSDTFKIATFSPSEPLVWEEFSFRIKTASRTESILLVLVSTAILPPFETWFDDVFVLPE